MELKFTRNFIFKNAFSYFFIEVKTSLAAFGRGKIYELASSWRYCVRINRIEFQEALIRFSKLGFPVAYGKFLSYEDYI